MGPPGAGLRPRATRFLLIAGERRWRAARAAGLAAVPAMVRRAGERQALILADLENNPHYRIGLSPAEKARFARRFLGSARATGRRRRNCSAGPRPSSTPACCCCTPRPPCWTPWPRAGSSSATPNCWRGCRRPPRRAPWRRF
ncbi:MAG: ParB N-terminal domain-containing protein [Candidatus Competibacteraceae bacterium]|nr:ParB N-terminal domain-containing protein [Candidatus Competibacteraceae bacterium]